MSSSFFSDASESTKRSSFSRSSSNDLGDVDQFPGVLQILFVIGLENLVLLFLAVGQADVFGFTGAAACGWLLRRQAGAR